MESIKLLTKEIKLHFETAKKKLVEGVAMGGSAGGKGNIWKAVKIAKNFNTNSLPKNMTLGDTPIATCDTANVFGQFFANNETYTNETCLVFRINKSHLIDTNVIVNRRGMSPSRM